MKSDKQLVEAYAKVKGYDVKVEHTSSRFFVERNLAWSVGVYCANANRSFTQIAYWQASTECKAYAGVLDIIVEKFFHGSIEAFNVWLDLNCPEN